MKSGAAFSVDLGDLLALPGVGAIYTSGGEFCFQPVGVGNGLRSFVRRTTLTNSYWYLQQLTSWLAIGKDTGGTMSLVELSGRKGLEAPPHIHTREDEVYFILEGEATFYRGQEMFEVHAGDAIFLPRGMRHWHTVRTPRWKTLIATAPAGIESYYFEFSRPAKSMEMPGAYDDPVDFAKTLPRLIEVGERYGIWYPPGR